MPVLAHTGMLRMGLLGAAAALCGAFLGAGGCIFKNVPIVDQYSELGPATERPYDGHNAIGIELQNTTDRSLLVELLENERDGSTTSIGRSVLVPDGQYMYKVPAADFRNGRRVRIGLPNADGRVTGDRVSGQLVELQLPSKRTRYYDLSLESGRLMAREHPQGFHRRGPSEYNWGD